MKTQYGLIITGLDKDNKPYLHMDNVCHDTELEAISEASSLRRHCASCVGIFSVDELGNFATVHNSISLDSAIHDHERDQLSPAERHDEDIADHKVDARS